MSTIVTMTLDEVKKMPPLSDERLKEILDFQDTEDPDSPVPTKEQLREFRPWYEVHPEGNSTYKVKVTKTPVSLRLDSDILDAFKSTGKGYQTKINDALRNYIKEHPEWECSSFCGHSLLASRKKGNNL